MKGKLPHLSHHEFAQVSGLSEAEVRGLRERFGIDASVLRTQPLLFGTIADAEKCAAAYVSWLQQYPDPRADGAQFAFYTQVFPTYPSAALDEAGEP